MRVGELFAGIGGFGLAAERAGMLIAWASEIDPHAQKVYGYHFPGIQQIGDVTKWEPNPATDAVDIITAGFPCQDLSVAGKRKGLRGERSGLFWEIIRVARRLRPRWLLLENVPGLFSSPPNANGRDFAIILAALDELGYGVAWTVLDAQYAGLAQRRERVFLVGHLGAPCPPEILFEPEGVCGDTPPGEEARARIAGSIASCLNSGGNDGGFWTEPGEHIIAAPLTVKPYADNEAQDSRLVVGTLAASGAGSARPAGQANEANMLIVSPTLRVGGRDQGAGDSYDNTPWVIKGAAIGREPESGPQYGEVTQGPCYTLNATEQHAIAHALRAEGADASEDGTGRGTPLVIQESQTGLRRYANAGALRAEAPGSQPTGSLLWTGTVVRRLTPRECERLQGFPEVAKSCIIQVCSPDPQEKGAPAGDLNPKSRRSAFAVVANGLLLPVKSAIGDSGISPHVPDLPVALDVQCDSRPSGLRIHSRGRLIWSADSVDESSTSPLPMPPASFARLIAPMWLAEGLGITIGEVAAPHNNGPFLPLLSGTTFVRVSGREIAALATAATELRLRAKELTRFITSPVGSSSAPSAEIWTTWSSYVCAAISGFIPAETRAIGSYAVRVTMSRGWTEIEGASDSARYRMLGNAVAEPVAEWILRRIAAAAFKVKYAA